MNEDSISLLKKLSDKLSKDRKGLIKEIRDYADKCGPDMSLIPLLKKMISQNDHFLQETAMYVALFRWKMKDDFIESMAKEFVHDKSKDEDVRIWAISGLVSSYEGSMNRELLILLRHRLEDHLDDDDVRKVALRGILKLSGFDSPYIFSRAKSGWLWDKSITYYLNKFEVELGRAYRIIEKG